MEDASSYEVDIQGFKDHKVDITLETEISFCGIYIRSHLNLSDPTSTITQHEGFCCISMGNSRILLETGQIQAIIISKRMNIGVGVLMPLIIGIVLMALFGSIGFYPGVGIGGAFIGMLILYLIMQLILYIKNPYSTVTFYASGYNAKVIILRDDENKLIQKIRLWHRLRSDSVIKMALKI